MSDHEDPERAGARSLDEPGDLTDGIDVQSGVDFVEDGHLRLGDRQLEHLGTLLLPTRQAFVDGPIETGEHNIRWDGRTASGRLLSSGTYFVRLEVAGQVLSGKVVLLK